MGAKSLTRNEAEQRAALLTVDRYDLAVDLRGLFAGEVLESTATITFRCGTPGTETFVDCAMDVRTATLNGVPLDLATVADGRIPLPDLAADNVLVVTATQDDTAEGAGILRTVDPTDDLVYVWTSFEPDEARRVWACFDQPDLKAPHRFTVSAPPTWTVTSNDAPESVTDLEDGRLWTFPDTPPLSTYVVVVNAGPFHEIRSERGDHDLGIFCRQSLRGVLERDAPLIFDVTEQGLAFFGEQFGRPFPQRRYDQVFVPDMGGAMENWGCVTWGDGMVTRSAPSYNDEIYFANVILHEMAHQWFGDLVTMQWWDDLWLNEAFASWAADWALTGATRFTDAHAVFLAQFKMFGYRDDMGPATHPIRADIPDVDAATANFDSITYIKGQGVLAQLVAYVGEEAFVAGLRAYFRDHAWGNTRLDDLMSAIGTAADRDLGAWTHAWLDRAGTDTLTLGDGAITAASPDDDAPRPHRLDIGCYSRTGSGRGLELTETVEVETAGVSTPVTLPAADLRLLNDGDLTFAAVRSDEATTRALLDGAGDLPTALGRGLAVTTAWDMLVKGELPTAAFLDCVLAVLEREDSPALVEPFLTLAQRAVERWTPDAQVATAQRRLADVAAALAAVDEHRQPALSTLAATATDDAHFALLDEAVAGADDTDLAWSLLTRRAELGDPSPAAVAALLERDPDPDARVRALCVRAAQAEQAAKEEAWTEVFEKRSVPAGTAMSQVASAFWRPGQTDLLLPFAHRYVDEATRLSGGGMLAVMSLFRMMVPGVADDDVIARGRMAADDPAMQPQVRSTMLTAMDTLARMQRAQAG
ncbi:aminopeptidase N [Nocardioides psychrotolerans]|uniref:Aminopeptidase N n=1 Tax=Nocardioides psychrotolerans TaxID=1005945 RepID=A0A1I3NPN5_9ACTN|nr:aminopeptidase N [Nocardioides psychrotolerans]GEP39385.1 aminopeptidase N [Nocardioides psychrotolerans]SFJ11225.1 aminopeptidase N [Nocardioides psychrotolerans]